MNDADTTWALVIGIDVYDHVTELKGPVRDAVAVVGWLRQLGVADERILLHASPCLESRDLLNDLGIAPRGCSQPQIWTSLSALLRNTGSRLFVFLLGHGYFLLDGGPVFLTQEADTDAATNYGIAWLSDLLRAKSYQRQFILMDGCLNHAYAGSQRPTITAGAYPGVAVGASLPGVSQWFGYAASQGEVAAEPNGRGLFTAMLLAAVDLGQPDPRCTTIDDVTGVYQIDFGKAITDVVNGAVAERNPTQHPGFRRLDTGSAGVEAFMATITPAQTVELRTLVDPMTAEHDVDSVTLTAQRFEWKRRVPVSPGGALTLPLTSVLPTGLKLNAWCEMKANTDWADPETETVTTGTGKDVVFKLNRERSSDVVKVTTVDVANTVVAAMNADAITEAMNIIAGTHTQGKLWLSPSRTGGTVYATAGEEHHLDSVSERIAAAIDSHTRRDVHVVVERQQLPSAGPIARWHGWMLDLDLDFDRAYVLGGFLADSPVVQIGESPTRKSLVELADLGQIAIDGLSPVRIVLDLPWGRWVTIVEPPDASGSTRRLTLPDTVGLPPVRNSLMGNVLRPWFPVWKRLRRQEPAVALAMAQTGPAELYVGAGDFASRLLSGDDRTDDWPTVDRDSDQSDYEGMPGGPVVYQYEGSNDPNWRIGKLVVGSSKTPLFFPMSYPNLAFDDRIAPRIEPLSLSTSPLWDLLVSAGRLEAWASNGGRAEILRSGDPLLVLAGMYGCYLNGGQKALYSLQEFFPGDTEDPDVVILRHAYAMKFARTKQSAWLSVDPDIAGLAAMATDGRVPVFKWGLGIGQAVARHFRVPALEAKLKRIEDGLMTASIWTLWHGN